MACRLCLDYWGTTTCVVSSRPACTESVEEPLKVGLALRGEAWQTSEDRQMLDYAIAKGEGGVYLRLSPDQYARLRRP
jgi:hypothetical protein